MRLQLIGNYTLEEFEVAVSKIVTNLKKNKINSFQNINIYLRTCVDGREVKFKNQGEPVEHLVFDFRQRHNISIISDDLTVSQSHIVDSKKLEQE